GEFVFHLRAILTLHQFPIDRRKGQVQYGFRVVLRSARQLKRAPGRAYGSPNRAIAHYTSRDIFAIRACPMACLPPNTGCRAWRRRACTGGGAACFGSNAAESIAVDRPSIAHRQYCSRRVHPTEPRLLRRRWLLLFRQFHFERIGLSVHSWSAQTIF